LRDKIQPLGIIGGRLGGFLVEFLQLCFQLIELPQLILTFRDERLVGQRDAVERVVPPFGPQFL